MLIFVLQKNILMASRFRILRGAVIFSQGWGLGWLRNHKLSQSGEWRICLELDHTSPPARDLTLVANFSMGNAQHGGNRSPSEGTCLGLSGLKGCEQLKKMWNIKYFYGNIWKTHGSEGYISSDGREEGLRARKRGFGCCGWTVGVGGWGLQRELERCGKSLWQR